MNLSATIAHKRREIGVTQEQLANHIGITKASVSKWETGQSLPDIALLPLLAAFFDMSIDELMDHSPQMSERDISALYQRLADDFATKPREEVVAECQAIIKKYYSCYSLLYRMAVLYCNHAMATEAIELLKRVAANSDNHQLVWEAVNLQAMCYLILEEGGKVLELLESVTWADKTLVASAYQMLGDQEKANQTLQMDLYEKLMEMFRTLTVILQNNLGNINQTEPVFLRAVELAKLFNMRHLNANNMVILHLLGAKMYQMTGDADMVMEQLVIYVDECKNLFPFAIKGDDFFNKINDYLLENAAPTPRNEAVVKVDMMQHLQDPIFKPLQDRSDYKNLVKKLKNFTETKDSDIP